MISDELILAGKLQLKKLQKVKPKKIYIYFLFYYCFQTMQEHAAVFRTGAVLADGCRKVDDIYKQTEDLKVPKIKFNFCSVTKLLQSIVENSKSKQ